MIFIDRLSFTSCLSAQRLLQQDEKLGIVQNVYVLDPINNTLSSWLIKLWMKLFSIKVNEADFFLGRLSTKNGKNLFREAQTQSDNIAYKTANNIINDSIALSCLNKKWNSKTILLYIYRYLFDFSCFGGNRIVLKILIAEALSREYMDTNNHLILGLPAGYKLNVFDDIKGSIDLSFYQLRKWTIKSTRLSVLLLIIYNYFKCFLKNISRSFKGMSILGKINDPAILLLQEDNFSLERTYRGQPHWIFTDDGIPQFRTIILGNKQGAMEYHKENMLDSNIYFATNDSLYNYSSNHPVHKKISYSLNVLLCQSLIRSDVNVSLLFELTQFFLLASPLADLCINQNIKAFMTCENSSREANIMNLIGSDIDVHSISYQFSNMNVIYPTMLCTADTICAFSPLFEERWKRNMFYNNKFVYIGYPYDSSFKLLIDRAKERREIIADKGGDFIIAYFDENVSRTKYGLTDECGHYQAILPLMKMVIKNKNIATIIKSQFQRNSPSIKYKDNENFIDVMQTGRWVELLQGQHNNTRNIYFPAEAALSSDIVIGHIEGSTAGLEAALVGTRCILLNTHNLEGNNVKIFEQEDILYADMKSALNAVAAYHRGDSEYQNLGDWSSIIDLFDAHQDGRSATRLRGFIADILLPGAL